MENHRIRTCAELLQEFQRSGHAYEPVKLHFEGVGNRDVYNITAPFEDVGQWVLAGRVESRDSEESEVVFFTRQNGSWSPCPGLPVFRLQDPFVTRIAKELVIGGVQTFPHPERAGALGWRTVFYKGPRLAEMKPLFTGPDGMKDLRLVELADGRIGVFTRPQGEKGGRGKIGFVIVRDFSELTLSVIDQAPLLEQFVDEEWGGANEVHRLSNGMLGVLGHIACFDEQGDRHYYPMVFALDPRTGRYTKMKLIATRSCFLPGAAKRPDLVDVVFSGGLVCGYDGKAMLFVGISDAEAQHITIPDPFLEYEEEGAFEE